MSGKGSTPRARQVSREEFERRWAETFGHNGYDTDAHGLRWLRPTGENVGMWRDLSDVLDDNGEYRAHPQADGDPGDDYAVERAGA